MQPVGNLDEDYPDVVAHGQQQFLERLGLGRRLVAEDASRYFCKPVYDLGDFRTEDVGEIFHGVVCVFYYVVEQGGADGGRTQTDFAAYDLGYGQRMHDVRFAGKAAHSFMGLFGKIKSLGNDFHLFAVARCQISVYQMLKGIVYHFILLKLLFG